MTRRGWTQRRALGGFQSPQQRSVGSGMPVYSEQDDCSFLIVRQPLWILRLQGRFTRVRRKPQYQPAQSDRAIQLGVR